MRTLYIDTETTGLPPRSSGRSVAPVVDSAAWAGCRMVQIAWAVYDDDTTTPDVNEVPVKSFIILPDGYEIPEVAAQIHGITTARARAEGVHLGVALDALMAVAGQCDVWVAHNVAFDRDVIASELHRTGRVAEAHMFLKMPMQCTMLMGTPKGGRWVRLVALYEKLFGVPMPGEAHRADVDVHGCMAVHQKMLRGVA